MRKYLILLLFVSFSTQAAQFIPVKIETQLKESDAVIHGYYRYSMVKKLPGDRIVTSHFFELLEVAGVAQNEIFNLNAFEVYTPGGLYNGRRVEVSGIPKFHKNEEVILLLSKTRYGWTVQNFALGKYNIVWDQKVKVLKSSVFPMHPILGHLDFNYFKTVVINQLGQSLVKPTPDNYIDKSVTSEFVKSTKGVSHQRSPASVNRDELANEREQSNYQLIWMAIFLGVLGSWMTWFHRRSDNNEEY
jgi:hypothetical protein